MRKKMKIVTVCVLVCIGFGFAAGSADAVIVYDDGLVHEIDAPVYEDIQVYDGPAGQPTLLRLITGADTGEVDVFENSRFEMTGGAIGEGELRLHNNSTAHISGGSISDDPSWIGDSSQLTITGIDFIDALKLAGDAKVFIHGSNFSINGVPVDYGPVAPPGGHLSGDLLNGHIECGLWFLSDSAAVTLIPEPATIALLAIGALALNRKRTI
jgi:hypothetical protein